MPRVDERRSSAPSPGVAVSPGARASGAKRARVEAEGEWIEREMEMETETETPVAAAEGGRAALRQSWTETSRRAAGHERVLGTVAGADGARAAPGDRRDIEPRIIPFIEHVTSVRARRRPATTNLLMS